VALSGRGVGRERIRRAMYGLNAARRIARDVIKGKTIPDAVRGERKHLQAHREARGSREAADRLSDAARDVYGRKLGWYLGPNENHCVVCQEAAGNNYYVSRPPSIGLPGAVHPHCDCSPGAPFPNGRVIA
jgi:hypothetical protein